MNPRPILLLEAARGIAAIVVMLLHFCMSFPAAGGWFPGWALRGNDAVLFFFTLSGFVLTYRYFQTGDTRYLADGAVKRLPRLAGTILVAVMFSWALIALGLTFHVQAAAINHSQWLATFGNALPFKPSFSDALWNGTLGVFIKGRIDYDTPLWTMRPELLGSFVVFGLAPLLRGRVTIWAAYSVVVALAFPSAFTWYFIAGMCLASMFVNGGYREPRLPAWLARPAMFLGRMSFPLYLVHTPVICTAGAFVFLKTGSVAVTFVVVVAVALVASLALAEFDRWWVGKVSAICTKSVGAR